MNISKLRIVIDDRERKSGIPKLLQGIGINAEIKTLPVGDYIVAPETIVERKSISDLISSVFDGRLFDQCTRLRKHYKNPIIIVEGNIDDIEKITENPLVFYGAEFAIKFQNDKVKQKMDGHNSHTEWIHRALTLSWRTHTAREP